MAKRSSWIVTYKIAGVSSGGGIGRGLATVHAGLDGSRPIEAVLAGLVPKRISNSLGYQNGRTECALEMRWSVLITEGGRGKKKRGTITGERSSGRAKYQSYRGGTAWYMRCTLSTVLFQSIEIRNSSIFAYFLLFFLDS